jgi:TPP-dependent pyruvate/acetoin dehydrogenase alpha subunit
VPTFRAFDLDGKLINKNIKYDSEQLIKILKTMIFVDEMDDILLKVKGQGKISFYMTSFG